MGFRKYLCFAAAVCLTLAAVMTAAPSALAAPETTETPVTIPVMAEIVNCAAAANVRRGASSDTARLGSVPLGGTYKVTAVNGDWYKIQYTDAQAGYVHKDYIKLLNPDTGAVLENPFATETPVPTPTEAPTPTPTEAPTPTPEAPVPGDTAAAPVVTPTPAPLITKDSGNGGHAFLLVGAGVVGTLAVEAVAALILLQMKKRK